ncbi:hypothetical protein [Thermogemmatispora sp.]|uniref:hypothetical protein n=1 Tax=Thermogemmatispora sp. TaxID=1968838 RepID=UPI001DC63BC7|nr:hypothetical protein [Thermogemmatispora sp.]MBX5451834.1 hypothetical protein [Thermogemmatispora sp.]
MPFGPHLLISSEAEQWVLNRVYYEPEQDDRNTFATALSQVIDEAQWYAVTSALLYQHGLPKGVMLRVALPGEQALTAAHEEVLEAEGFSPEALGWVLRFPLSWELDEGYRALQEELERRVDLRDPRLPHDEHSSVAEHNMNVLAEVAREALGLNLDGSFESVKKLDELLLMGG